MSRQLSSVTHTSHNDIMNGNHINGYFSHDWQPSDEPMYRERQRPGYGDFRGGRQTSGSHARQLSGGLTRQLSGGPTRQVSGGITKQASMGFTRQPSGSGRIAMNGQRIEETRERQNVSPERKCPEGPAERELDGQQTFLAAASCLDELFLTDL